MTYSNTSNSNPSSPAFDPFDFAPYPTQDAELLQQLGFVPGLKELLLVRQVHALEHATVWVLGGGCRGSEAESEGGAYGTSEALHLGGMSTDRGFYLFGQVDTVRLQDAVRVALRRITQGDWDLAVHPRCGTNVSVGILLTMGLAAGVGGVLPKDPISQLVGMSLAATAAASLAPDVGSLAQRHLTTAIPFNLEVLEVVKTQDMWGHPAHFVGVQWRE